MTEEDFPMIEVKKMNETEVRLFALLLNLWKESKGISFQRFRKIMSRYYQNEDIDSDRKKLYRDLNQLKAMGFNIKVASFGYQSEDHFPYYLEKESLDKVLKFSQEELEYLALSLCSAEDQDNQIILSLSQKLFSKNLDLYPQGIGTNKRRGTESADKEETELSKIIQAVKDKRAIVVSYGKDGKERTIEPYRLIRKNSEDFYLLAYDRNKKSLRRFILPRIVVKRELKEDFFSNKKITEQDTNFHPLGFDVHEKKNLNLTISSQFSDSFSLFLEGHTFGKEDLNFHFETTNQNALFPFFLKYPESLIHSDSDEWIRDYQNYLNQLSESYSSVA
ncbi:helix-turn-helix transcriptional regulator [Leptospira idonii]|uniref:WYL domain-containing protein n=1 Tax=Leptospira idonii TaxID=1193500 RepID=A0A4R9LZQ8_9LEPT|nr:WYL domain-containing protein [Leptospira idonii]TGN18985.1 WYL domain-containing protein [Leptospira idonii]